MNDNQPPLPAHTPELTVIMPFLNEGEEVENTARSIRQSVGERVEILAIDDGSDDGYPYEERLRPYRVRYVAHAEPKGVAASRDEGVSLCRTPFFLLLDAHMRFYESGWAETIVRLLRENDRRLLCCQTRAILRREDGTLEEKPENEYGKPHGAFQPLDKNSYLPDIKWNYRERYPDRDVEPIAAVLGAGYAASKRYWTYLRGLEGLLHYGSDEAFISYKVWMEGGECLLLKRHAIGHLYRTSAPYLKIQEKMVYNYLFIAELIFPPTLRHWAHAVACSKNKATYRRACVLLEERRTLREELSAYLKGIFTRPFEEVRRLHTFCMQRQMEPFLACNRLDEIDRWQEERLPAGYGIAEGRAAHILWNFHYARLTRRRPPLRTYEWMEETEEAVSKGMLSWNFRYGLGGIGWMYIFLFKHRFIRSYPKALLRRIDRQLLMLDLEAVRPDGLYDGAGGIFCYLSARVRLAREQGETTPLWGEPFRTRWKNRCLQAVSQSDDLYACFHAFRCLSLLQGEETDGEERWMPDLREWLDFPEHLPDEQAYWQAGLPDGCMGYGLLSIILQLKDSAQ